MAISLANRRSFGRCCTSFAEVVLIHKTMRPFTPDEYETLEAGLLIICVCSDLLEFPILRKREAAGIIFITCLSGRQNPEAYEADYCECR
jgi:hypothetical protein